MALHCRQRGRRRRSTEQGRSRPWCLLGSIGAAYTAAAPAAAAGEGAAEETAALVASEPLPQPAPPPSPRPPMSPPSPGRPSQCTRGLPVQRRAGDALEALLVEDDCPFLAAFFSESSPLAQSEGLVVTEQWVAAAFPDLQYFRVDANQLGMRAFLQWDISFLPTYVLYMPSGIPDRPGTWHRWKAEGGANPYSYQFVASFVERSSGFAAANTSRILEQGAASAAAWEPQRRGTDGVGGAGCQLSITWTLVAFAALHRWWCSRPSPGNAPSTRARGGGGGG